MKSICLSFKLVELLDSVHKVRNDFKTKGKYQKTKKNDIMLDI